MASNAYPCQCRENDRASGEGEREGAAERRDPEDKPGDVVADVPAVQPAERAARGLRDPNQTPQARGPRWRHEERRGGEADRRRKGEGRVEVGVRGRGVGGRGGEGRRRYTVENGPGVSRSVDEAGRGGFGGLGHTGNQTDRQRGGGEEGRGDEHQRGGRI